jgi:hypothetical protein
LKQNETANFIFSISNEQQLRAGAIFSISNEQQSRAGAIFSISNEQQSRGGAKETSKLVFNHCYPDVGPFTGSTFGFKHTPL